MFDSYKTTVGRPSAPSAGVSPTASAGKAHSCPPAQSPGTKLQITHIEDEIVDASIDDEAIEVQRPNVVVIGRGPTVLEVEHNVALHRTWCDACMKAEAGREDEGPLGAIDFYNVKLDGTEDDDDDEDSKWYKTH